MFQFLKWVCMWWDATLRSVSIEWRGHSAQQDDWGSVFWCKKKKHYYSMFFASLWACGGWYLAFCQQLEEGHMRVGVGGDAPLCGGVPGVYFRPTAHLSTKQRMQWLGCFFCVHTWIGDDTGTSLKKYGSFFVTMTCSGNHCKIGNLTLFIFIMGLYLTFLLNVTTPVVCY